MNYSYFSQYYKYKASSMFCNLLIVVVLNSVVVYTIY